ncbi:hypothetical protein ACJX0J_033130 [Zea mays]
MSQAATFIRFGMLEKYLYIYNNICKFNAKQKTNEIIGCNNFNCLSLDSSFPNMVLSIPGGDVFSIESIVLFVFSSNLEQMMILLIFSFFMSQTSYYEIYNN